MNNKKKMVLGAAFVVAIMALAGIGYAAANSYQGTTTSDETSYDVDYVVVSLGAAGYVAPTNLHVVYNTSTEATNAAGTALSTTYTPVSHTDTVTYNIVVKDTGDEDDTLVLKVKLAEAFENTEGYTLAVTYNGTEVELNGTTEVVLSNVKSTITTEGGVAFTVQVIAPASIVKTDGTYPATTVDVPAFVFTAYGADES